MIGDFPFLCVPNTFVACACLQGNDGGVALNDFIVQRLHAYIKGRAGSRKYRVVPSPLLAVHWQRVCLDEAQMVDVPTARAGKRGEATHTTSIP